MSDGVPSDGDLRATLSEDCTLVAVEEYQNGLWHSRDWDHCTAETVDDVLIGLGYLLGKWALRDGVARVPMHRRKAVA